MASVNDRIAGVNVTSMRAAGASHIRGVSELVASGKRYIIRASMFDFQVFVASAEHLTVSPEIAFRGTCWLYYVAEASGVILDKQGMAIDAFAGCVMRVRHRIRRALGRASTGNIKGSVVLPITLLAIVTSYPTYYLYVSLPSSSFPFNMTNSCDRINRVPRRGHCNRNMATNVHFIPAEGYDGSNTREASL